MTREDVLFSVDRSRLKEKEDRKLLLQAREQLGSTDLAAKRLGLTREQARVLLLRPPHPDYPGTAVPSLTLDDVLTRTLPQIRQKFAYGRIVAVRHLASQRAIAEFLGYGEEYVRRVIAREEEFARTP